MRVYKFRGKWWSSWTEHGKTVKRSCRTTDSKTAEILARRWERERADPAHAAAAKASFAVEARNYLDDRTAEKIPAGTLNMYECKIGHLGRLLPVKLGSLDAKAVDAYFATRKAEGASVATLYKEWVALRQVLRSAARRGCFGQDIGSLKPRWVTASYVPKTRHLTLLELARLCRQLPDDRAAVVRFAFATGARCAEVFRAQREDVDLRKWTVRLRGTKTAKAARVIPVPAMFRDALRAGVQGGRKAIGRPMFEAWGNARRDLAAAAARAKVPAPTWNDLRRSFASLLVQAGVSNVVVAKLLGHATTAMVDLAYGQHTTDALAMLLRSQTIGTPGSQRPAKRNV